MSDQKRTYRKSRRADLEGQTRLRITESAVRLHEELGPARTSISAVAEERILAPVSAVLERHARTRAHLDAAATV